MTASGSAAGCPRIIGIPGGGLVGADGQAPGWAANAEVARHGHAGELRTAAVLDGYARRESGPTVLHDLRMPIPGIKANIDHVVVSGRRVYVVDSKVWRPARYWTLAGHSRRGWRRFPPAEKKTMPMAAESLTRFLTGRRLAVQVRTPLVVVWPSSQRRPTSLWALSVPGAKVASGAAFTRRSRRLFGAGPASVRRGVRGADPHVVAALRELLPEEAKQPAGVDGVGDADPFG